MRVDDILKNRTPQPDPRLTDTADLAFLRARLSAAGYDWPGVERLLGTSVVNFAEYPGYAWRCRNDGTSLSALVKLWLLNERLPRVEVEAILGRDGVETLLERRLLRSDGDQVSALVDLYPCEGAHVLTDHASAPVRLKKHVYELGSDSYATARMTPRRHIGRALDLCTGSGIHAILAAHHADHATGVDISDRAQAFAQVNAALNGVAERTRFLLGDLYEAVPGETFDLVTANPPWIAAPSGDMELYRWGGETGEGITRRIVEGLPQHLEVGGTLSMFVIYPIMRGRAYLDRVREWLPDSGWGVAIAESTETSLESFIRLHLEVRDDWGRYVRECGEWMDLYARHGIERMGIGMAYVRRLPEGRPGWGATRRMVMPPCAMNDWVARWLDDLERYAEPSWQPAWDTWRPAVGDRVGRLWRDLHTGEGQVEFRNPHWGAPVPLTGDETSLLEMLSRGETATQIAARWGNGAAARGQVRDLLASLGRKEIL